MGFSPRQHFNLRRHLNLLSQQDRVKNLREVISRVVQPGDRILDAGCGTGVLGLMALKAGAAELVGVDINDLSMARRLADANGLAEQASFIEADLNDIGDQIDHNGKFDTLFSFVFSNHPIRDEKQITLASKLATDYLKPGGKQIPDRTRYHAVACQWPEVGRKKILADISKLTNKLGGLWAPLQFDCLADDIGSEHLESFRPDAITMGMGKLTSVPLQYLGKAGLHMLTRPSLLIDSGPDQNGIQPGYQYPEYLELEIQTKGVVTAILWVRELLHGDNLISQRNSFSPMETPLPVSPGNTCSIRLNQAWRESNLIQGELT